jgi:hypothetical protein
MLYQLILVSDNLNFKNNTYIYQISNKIYYCFYNQAHYIGDSNIIINYILQ